MTQGCKGWEHLRFWNYWNTVKQYEPWSDAQGVLPPSKDRFKALELTPLESVKCVILGQDPYPTPGHAMGLAFSVYPHVSPVPRSLGNIFREYTTDLGYPRPRTGDLSPWAQEGVLLLNTCLTVEAGKPGSHVGIGWEKLTYEVVREVDRKGGAVFVLWGKHAQAYRPAIENCHVLVAPHPSPFSASKGFYGSRPFTRTNEWLVSKGIKPINWRLP